MIINYYIVNTILRFSYFWWLFNPQQIKNIINDKVHRTLTLLKAAVFILSTSYCDRKRETFLVTLKKTNQFMQHDGNT